jgi:lysyl-tRNA synthetase class 2
MKEKGMAWEPTPLEEKRLEKIEQLREAGIEPYPLRVERTHTSSEAIAAFAASEAEQGEAASEIEVTLCGRIVSQRDMGKTVFAHIEDGYGRIQLFVRREAIGEESHQIFRKLLDLGDFVQATGILFRTRTGEVSLRVSDWKLLAKAVSPLPVVKEQEIDGEIVRHNAFSDVEERYRQRYADLG